MGSTKEHRARRAAAFKLIGEPGATARYIETLMDLSEEEQQRRVAAFQMIATIGIDGLLDMLGPQIMRTMKDAAARVIWSFPKYHDGLSLQAQDKGGKEGGNWVTKADKRGQKVYLKLLVEDWILPYGFGFIGEEDGMVIPCTIPGVDAYFTVDPYDGTGALVRGQSHAIGTMCALIVNGVVVAVLVGDVNSQELYYFRPGSEKTHRLYMRAERAKPMLIDPERTLKSQRLLLRSMLHTRSAIVQSMILDGLFHDAGMANGSIGISMARLWKGEVGGAVMAHPGSTPWDTSPVIGLSQRLGFDFYQINDGDPRIIRFDPKPPKEVESQEGEILVIHGSRREEFEAWCSTSGLQVATST